MSLLENAKRIKKEEAEAALVNAKYQEEQYAVCKERKELLTTHVLQELRQLDWKESKHGTFRLEVPSNSSINDVFAYLYAGEHKVAWFKSYVRISLVNGKTYYDAQLTARFHLLGVDKWFEEEDIYIDVQRNTVYFMHQMPEFLNWLAKQLSKWVENE